MFPIRDKPDPVSFLLWNLLINKILLQFLGFAVFINRYIVSRLPMPDFYSIFYYIIIKPFRVGVSGNITFPGVLLSVRIFISLPDSGL